MNLIRYYNQNRKNIWKILIIIIFAFLMLQLLARIYDMREKNKTIVNNNEEKEIKTNTVQLTNNRSSVTGQNLNKEQLESATTVIDKFISYCNERELQKAYDLLTDDCKKQIYNTLEVFEKAYYENLFEGKTKNCTVENWVNNTYKVKITEDMLSTGKSNDGYAKQDYITVKKEADSYKININNYIGNSQINRTTEKDKIIMEVLNRNTYMEYEEYTIKITNKTDNIMVLDGKTNVESLYLEDSKENHYPWYSNELTQPMLTLSQGETKEVTIRFYSSYISTKKIKDIVFSDLILYKDQLGEVIEFKAQV